VELLFDLLTGTSDAVRTEVLPVELIVRESAGPPAPGLSTRFAAPASPPPAAPSAPHSPVLPQESEVG
jgi:hypothetical protein